MAAAQIAQIGSTNQHQSQSRPNINHILMASFELAEQEASKINNQNFQQSPPLQANNSSHSSPSNSKYNSVTSKNSLRLQAASPTGTGTSNDYVNVNVHDGKMALQAQRKLSEASLTSRSMKPRERRNSFREAIGKKHALKIPLRRYSFKETFL